MATKKILREHVLTEVNSDTGEITKESKLQAFNIPTEPDFVKVYLQDVAYVNNVPGTSPLIFELLKFMTYDGIIVLNASIKRLISEKIDIQVAHIDNQLSKLTKAGVFIRRDRGLYEANPYIFGKGLWKDIRVRRENLGITLEYTKDGGRKVNYKVSAEEQQELPLAEILNKAS